MERCNGEAEAPGEMAGRQLQPQQPQQQMPQQIVVSNQMGPACTVCSPLDQNGLSNAQLVHDAVRALHLPIPATRISRVEGPVLQMQPVQGDASALDVRVLTSFRAHFDPLTKQPFQPQSPAVSGLQDHAYPQVLSDPAQQQQLVSRCWPASRPSVAPPLLRSRSAPAPHLLQQQQQLQQEQQAWLRGYNPQQQPHSHSQQQQQQQQQQPVLVVHDLQQGDAAFRPPPPQIVIESESSGGRTGSHHTPHIPSHQFMPATNFAPPLAGAASAAAGTAAAQQHFQMQAGGPSSSGAEGVAGSGVQGAPGGASVAGSHGVKPAEGGVPAPAQGRNLVFHSPFAPAAYADPPPSLSTSAGPPCSSQAHPQQQQLQQQQQQPSTSQLGHQASPFAGANFQVPWSLHSLPHDAVSRAAAAAAAAEGAGAEQHQGVQGGASCQILLPPEVAVGASRHGGEEEDLGVRQQGLPGLAEGASFGQQLHQNHQQPQQPNQQPNTHCSSVRSEGASVHTDAHMHAQKQAESRGGDRGAGGESVSGVRGDEDSGKAGGGNSSSAGSRGSASPCAPDRQAVSGGREAEVRKQQQQQQQQQQQLRQQQGEGCRSEQSGGKDTGSEGVVLDCGAKQQEEVQKGVSASSPMNVVPLRVHYCEQLAAAADAAKQGHIEAAVREVERTQQALDEAARVPYSAILQAWPPNPQQQQQQHLPQLRHPGQVQLLPPSRLQPGQEEQQEQQEHEQQGRQLAANPAMPGAAAVQAFKRAGSRAAGLEVGPCNIPSSEWELNGMHVQYGKRIAVGGFAEVFAGKYLGTLVAIKKLLATDPDAVRHFAHEVRVLARLRHPNLILFIGYCLRPEPAILYEFMPRGSLFNIMRQHKGPLEPKMQRVVAGCVARGMAYLHSRNPPILHLDLKSPNILVDAQWRIKVCDFGLSAVRRQAFLSSACAGGTPEWMAPEMLRCEDYDEKADVWSFGVVLWELLTGEVPFVDLSPMQVVGMVGFKRQSLSPPGQGDTTLQQLCVMCMTQDPTERPSFTAILDCMDKAYHNHHGSGSGTMPNACQSNGSDPQHHANGQHVAPQVPRVKLIEAGAASSEGGGQQSTSGVEKAGMPAAVAGAQGAPHVPSGSSVQDPVQKRQPDAVHGSQQPPSSSKTPRQNAGESPQPSKSRRLHEAHCSPSSGTAAHQQQ